MGMSVRSVTNAELTECVRSRSRAFAAWRTTFGATTLLKAPPPTLPLPLLPVPTQLFPVPVPPRLSISESAPTRDAFLLFLEGPPAEVVRPERKWRLSVEPEESSLAPSEGKLSPTSVLEFMHGETRRTPPLKDPDMLVVRRGFVVEKAEVVDDKPEVPLE